MGEHQGRAALTATTLDAARREISVSSRRAGMSLAMVKRLAPPYTPRPAEQAQDDGSDCHTSLYWLTEFNLQEGTLPDGSKLYRVEE